VKTAAEVYDVNDRTVRRWIDEGLITGYRVGRTLVKVDLHEVDAKVVKVILTVALARPPVCRTCGRGRNAPPHAEEKPDG